MTDSTVIVRVDEELKAAFTQAAKAADRTASQLLRDFMRDYVREQANGRNMETWLHTEVAASVDEYRADPETAVTVADVSAALDARLRSRLVKPGT